MMPRGFVHEVFRQVADLYPQHAAIESGDRRISYAQLRQSASAAACSLRTAGVTPGSSVLIFAEDRIRTIAGMLGVLECGAAFVPLTAGIPGKRLESMLRQSAPIAALVEPELMAEYEQAAGALGIPAIASDSGGWCSPNSEAAAAHRSGPDDLSYIVFTSGSTGVPKPIAGRLKAIDHFVRWEIETFGIDRSSRISQLFSPMFDACLRDIFTPLCAGATICIPPDRDTTLDGRALALWLKRFRVTHVHTVPSVLRVLLDHAQEIGGWPDLQRILVAGEALTPLDVRRWYECPEVKPSQLVNLYGPSETTMTKFFYIVRPEDQDRRTIPIGRPMPGAKAIVVSDSGRACPPGVVGEIYIRTPFSSLGYYRQPEMTAEVFVQNPFSETSGDLVYKTGDLARVLEDGNFELVGRRDHQVKVRGVRVELGEIEAALARYPVVSQCAVVAKQGRYGTQLAAYVVGRAGASLNARQVRDHLRDWLPAHSIPDVLVPLDAMPMTANGKIDRQRLPPPGSLNPDAAECGPRDVEEEILCAIFAGVLGRSTVGVHENFFEIGGHSLLATKIISRVRNTFRVDLRLHTLFEAPTVAELTGRVRLARNQTSQQQSGPAREIGPGAGAGELVLSSAQQRLWFFTQLDPSSAAYNITFGLRLRGRLAHDALRRAVQQIMQRHDVLRTGYPAVDGVPTVRIEEDLPAPVEFLDLGQLPETEREAGAHRILHSSANTPFEIGRGPLFRVVVIQVSPTESAMGVTVHHLVADAWSSGVFITELNELYASVVENHAPALPALRMQYQDFARWERSWLSSELLESQLEYWRNRLAGSSHVLELPADLIRPPIQSFRGGTQLLSLDAEVVEGLDELGRQTSATRFMALLALMNVWLYNLSGQDDILIGSPVSTRNSIETENLIGLFLNTLVLRNRVEPGRPFSEFLREVCSNALDAYAHQAVPFERIIEELRIPRDAGRNPLIQVMLNIEHLQPPPLKLRDLQVDDSDTSFVRSRFDIHLGARRRPKGMELILIYNADLFLPETARIMLGAFGELARMTAAAPRATIAEMDGFLKTWRQDSFVLVQRERAARRVEQLPAAQRRRAARTSAG